MRWSGKAQSGWLGFGLLLGCFLLLAPEAAAMSDYMKFWQENAPDAKDFKEEIVSESDNGGIYRRGSYISVMVNGHEIRMYCVYAVKKGAKNAPALLNTHGWMSTARIANEFVQDGWAQLSFDYCGERQGREHYSKYPEALEYGNMQKPGVYAHDRERKPITDPKQTSHYIWYMMQRRALEYLLAQKEVDKTRVGARGYSYGGTLMWDIGTDPRVKAIVSYFGIGYITYYRDKGVWMYKNPYHEPEKTAGEKLYLKTMAPQAAAPDITAAALWLNGTNDHHGGFERGLEIFKKFRANVPWSYALQPKGMHDTQDIKQNEKLWLNKYVLGKSIDWPAQPKSEIKLDAKGVPEYFVTPAEPENVEKLTMYYALKEPVSFGRFWRDVKVERQGNVWRGSLPVINVDDYVFAFANIRYKSTIVRTTDFNAAIPAKLGKAVATDTKEDTFGAAAGWSNVAPAVGKGGIEAFRPMNKRWGTTNKQFVDPKWKANKGAVLTFKFYCTQPQKLKLVADSRFERALDITASNDWQSITIPAKEMVWTPHKVALKQWSQVNALAIKPQPGADITKVIFADFQWQYPEAK